LAVFSFHQTKNIQCGEGGALCVNNPRFIEHAQLLQHCGTNKAAFLQGKVAAYTWQVFSSNYLMSELQAAFLVAQLQQCHTVTNHLQKMWQHYFRRLSSVLSPQQSPLVPPQSQHNGHCLTILCASEQQRQESISFLQKRRIQGVFHYQPLQRAPVWHGMFGGEDLPVTQEVAATILRLPMHFYLTLQDVDAVCDALITFFAR
jgi:dTDP-4-amino-4,6-dideoxygalactose transaminase